MEGIPMDVIPHTVLSLRREAMKKRAKQYLGEDANSAETYLLFLQVARELLAGFQARLEEFGLSEGKLAILLMLYDAPDHSLTPSELAERCEVTRGTVTGLIDGLERSGLVERKSHLEDRRMLHIQLTPQGLTFVDEKLPQHFQRFKEMIQRAALSEVEQQQLRVSLNKIRNGVPALTEP